MKHRDYRLATTAFEGIAAALFVKGSAGFPDSYLDFFGVTGERFSLTRKTSSVYVQKKLLMFYCEGHFFTFLELGGA